MRKRLCSELTKSSLLENLNAGDHTSQQTGEQHRNGEKAASKAQSETGHEEVGGEGLEGPGEEPQRKAGGQVSVCSMGPLWLP